MFCKYDICRLFVNFKTLQGYTSIICTSTYMYVFRKSHEQNTTVMYSKYPQSIYIYFIMFVICYPTDNEINIKTKVLFVSMSFSHAMPIY